MRTLQKKDMPAKFNFRRMIVIFIIMAALFSFFACKNKQKNEVPSVPVIVSEASAKDVPLIIEDIGTVEAYRTVLVKTRIGGEIIKVHFKEGEDVKNGDLLITIDQRPYDAEFKEAEAALSRDKAKLKSAIAESERYADLVKKDYITKQEYDDAAANTDSLKAMIRSDEANVENARLNLNYCLIKASISGRLGNLLVHEGNLLKGNDDKEIVTLNQITPIYVTFSVPEQRLSEIGTGVNGGELQVIAYLPENKEIKYKGKLTFINNTVNSETGMILLKALFPNDNKKLWPGQFVNVELVLKTIKDVIVIPVDAIQKGQQGDFVFVVNKDMTVDMRPITVGQKMNSEAVVLNGLKQNEKVVTDGQFRLYPGARVELKTKLED